MRTVAKPAGKRKRVPGSWINREMLEEKVLLGPAQTATENVRVLTEFLQRLVALGLRLEAGPFQKLRWVTSALLDMEPWLQRVKGFWALTQLRAVLLRITGRTAASVAYAK